MLPRFSLRASGTYLGQRRAWSVKSTIRNCRSPVELRAPSKRGPLTHAAACAVVLVDPGEEPCPLTAGSLTELRAETR